MTCGGVTVTPGGKSSAIVQGDPSVIVQRTTRTVVVEGEPAVVIDPAAKPSSVIVGVAGPQGPQGPEGPQGPAGPGSDTKNLEAEQDIVAGMALYVTIPGRWGRADQATKGPHRVAAIATTAGLAGFAVDGTTQGIVTLLAAEWDAVTGQVGGLTPGAAYFLGLDGALTTTVTTASGHFLVYVGRALNATCLDVDPRTPRQRR